MKRFWMSVMAALISTAALGVAAGPATAAPATVTVEDPGNGGACGTVCWAHYVVFRGRPMMEWYAHVKATPNLSDRFDMDNNGCSAPGWTEFTTAGWSEIFHRACVIHDFGYRNFGPGEIHVNRAYLTFGQPDWDADTDKEWIDQRFKQMMMWICAERDQPGGPDAGHWDTCEKWANTYYSGVRWGGNDAWNNG